MPIFQDDLGAARVTDTPPAKPIISSLAKSPPDGNGLSRKLSEESIRTDLCEGPVPDSLEENKLNVPGILASGFQLAHSTSDRSELIQRLKRGESPTWLPNRNLESLLFNLDQTPQKSTSSASNTPPLLPSPDISELARQSDEDITHMQAGLQIERPRSALHSGDFTEPTIPSDGAGRRGLGQNAQSYGVQNSPWLSTSPPRNFSPFQLDTRFRQERLDFGTPRSRAPSLSSSLSSSFILKPPTSPLVQSQSNDDLDYSSHMNPIDITPEFQRSIRRHTLASHSANSTPLLTTPPNFNRPLPHLRRDNTFPYQAHQPRRSLTSSSFMQSVSTPPTPEISRSRRPSYSESSPLHASMVGSYEESILRGRMSTTPSKPLDFVAQIGVLGLGKCKSSLRCPAHVTIPFPAVFYSYETTSHGRLGKAEDGPSPYVGQIDLESNLENQEEARDTKRKRHSAVIGRSRPDDFDMADTPSTNQPTEREIRRSEKQKRRSTSPKAPPGGSYRIPEKGQLQIIIKNPNKTAVKLFLVPYDLAGMEPGTKTFIRQRSYSAGPIIDSALSSAVEKPVTNPLDRPTLRYLVHLHICCPSRGRFYLYKSIRVVFANRVPDGKEKLRNEISIPEPRFSVYKPSRDSGFGLGITSAGGASLTAEKAFRRRSSGFALGPSNRQYDSTDGIAHGLGGGFNANLGFALNVRDSGVPPIQPIPFSFARQPFITGDDSGQERPSNVQSPTSSKSSRPPTSQGTSNSWNSNSPTFGGYDKLSKGDAGYGGNMFAGSPGGKHGVPEGLLAQKLRDFGMGLSKREDGIDGA